jgi:hypothetical protein
VGKARARRDAAALAERARRTLAPLGPRAAPLLALVDALARRER